ncbi:hypothetical protein BKN14_03855 [Candidatus Gracilibacteria bacterium HOT-871]|nr:hypothetical protein BKN14_03855 [Candidatus Gracilibacteria bacterium HOT-871]
MYHNFFYKTKILTLKNLNSYFFILLNIVLLIIIFVKLLNYLFKGENKILIFNIKKYFNFFYLLKN